MISARRALLGHLRGFFERETCDLYAWGQVVVHPGEDAEPGERGRKNPLGKFREVVTANFGDYEVTMESPEHHPPLGWVSLSRGGRVECDGSLDDTTWVRIGNFIKGTHNDDKQRDAARTG